MSAFTLHRREFLAGVAGLAAAPYLSAQNVTPPPGPSGPIAIQTDRPTLLMGDEAVIAGGPKPGIVGSGCKRLQVRNWNAAEDSFTWQVDVPTAGEFGVTALTKSKGAVLELKSGEQKFEVPVSTAWDRINLGTLKLKKGTHEISLRAPKPGEKMELYSLAGQTRSDAQSAEAGQGYALGHGVDAQGEIRIAVPLDVALGAAAG